MYTTAPLAPGFGTIVTASSGAKVTDLPVEEVASLLKQSGALVFRGFGADDEDFKALSEKFTHSFAAGLHAGSYRDVVGDGGKTSTVNLGQNLVGHHCELSYSPLRPDLLWFLCVTPAARGGETFLADGVELWEKLPAGLKSRFAAQRIKYVFPRADKNVWPVYTGAWLEVDATARALAALPGVSHRVNPDGTIDIEYVTSAVQRVRGGDALAFVNSVIVHDDGAIFFEDGTPITQELKWELLAAANELTVSVKWKAGEIIMVDNSRMMHGRMPFADKARKIHVRMGMAAF